MKIIKLNAIASTNSFLKEMVSTSECDDFTVVVTNDQTEGKGQRDAKWVSEPFKNLTFSAFTKDLGLAIEQHRFLSFAISLSVYETLYELNIPSLKIKWPNDIMSVSDKICGILIENQIKGAEIYSSVIGIGLNVNQTNFSIELEKASSLKKIMGKDFDLDKILNILLKNLQSKIQILKQGHFTALENDYLSVLFRKDIPAMFEDLQNHRFMGIIRTVSRDGNLIIELENGNEVAYGVKEVKFI